MAKFYNKITSRVQKFIENQHIFFVATAPENGRINLSPKGMDSLRVIEKNRLIWLNVTGSGNETSAHILENGRMTIMFCSFEGAPNILRIYGTAKEVTKKDENWEELASLLPKISGARQIFDVTVESAQTSCGMSIPLYEFKGERDALNKWANEKGKEGIEEYWQEKNTKSIDGLPTRI